MTDHRETLYGKGDRRRSVDLEKFNAGFDQIDWTANDKDEEKEDESNSSS